MSSLFESQVRSRRNHTPWARMSLLTFAKEMALNCGCSCKDKTKGEHGFRLDVAYRPSVASGFWFTVSWCGLEGDRIMAESMELDLALWRAAEIQLEAQRREAGQAEPLRLVPGGSPENHIEEELKDLRKRLEEGTAGPPGKFGQGSSSPA